MNIFETQCRTSAIGFIPDMELGHWVTRSMGYLSRLGHRVIILTRCETGVFLRFSKICPKCKTYIWNAEMTKVIVRCLLLDWYHWMSVHAMNFYFYLWLLKILWTENTSSHISRHLENRVTGSSGSPGRWIPGSLGRWVTKCDPVPSLVRTLCPLCKASFTAHELNRTWYFANFSENSPSEIHAFRNKRPSWPDEFAAVSVTNQYEVCWPVRVTNERLVFRWV